MVCENCAVHKDVRDGIQSVIEEACIQAVLLDVEGRLMWWSSAFGAFLGNCALGQPLQEFLLENGVTPQAVSSAAPGEVHTLNGTWKTRQGIKSKTLCFTRWLASDGASEILGVVSNSREETSENLDLKPFPSDHISPRFQTFKQSKNSPSKRRQSPSRDISELAEPLSTALSNALTRQLSSAKDQAPFKGEKEASSSNDPLPHQIGIIGDEEERSQSSKSARKSSSSKEEKSKGKSKSSSSTAHLPSKSTHKSSSSKEHLTVQAVTTLDSRSVSNETSGSNVTSNVTSKKSKRAQIWENFVYKSSSNTDSQIKAEADSSVDPMSRMVDDSQKRWKKLVEDDPEDEIGGRRNLEGNGAAASSGSPASSRSQRYHESLKKQQQQQQPATASSSKQQPAAVSSSQQQPAATKVKKKKGKSHTDSEQRRESNFSTSGSSTSGVDRGADHTVLSLTKMRLEAFGGTKRAVRKKIRPHGNFSDYDASSPPNRNKFHSNHSEDPPGSCFAWSAGGFQLKSNSTTNRGESDAASCGGGSVVSFRGLDGCVVSGATVSSDESWKTYKSDHQMTSDADQECITTDVTMNLDGGGVRLGSLSLQTRCTRYAMRFQRSVIAQQQQIMSLMGEEISVTQKQIQTQRDIHQEQKKLLQRFRKVVSKEPVESQATQCLTHILVVEPLARHREEVQSLCEILGYEPDAEANGVFSFETVQEAKDFLATLNVSGEAGGKFILVMLSAALLEDLPTDWIGRHDVALVSDPDELSRVGDILNAQDTAEIREKLTEVVGIKEYLHYPLSLESLRGLLSSIIHERLSEDYLLLENIGRGSQAVVYRVKRLSDGQVFALKEIHTARMKDIQRRQVETELELMRTFTDWPGLMVAKDFWHSQHFSYIVLPLMSGGSLEKLVAAKASQKTNIELTIIMNWIAQLILAVLYLHNRRILHRDIKPGNIILEHSQRRLVLADFGISLVLDDAEEFLDEGEAGTILYLSPEARHENVFSRASDLWALGCVIYEVVMLQRFAKESSIPDGPLEQPDFASLLFTQYSIQPGQEADKSEDEHRIEVLCDILKGLLNADSKLRPSAAELAKIQLFENVILTLLSIEALKEEEFAWYEEVVYGTRTGSLRRFVHSELADRIDDDRVSVTSEVSSRHVESVRAEEHEQRFLNQFASGSGVNRDQFGLGSGMSGSAVDQEQNFMMKFSGREGVVSPEAATSTTGCTPHNTALGDEVHEQRFLARFPTPPMSAAIPARSRTSSRASSSLNLRSASSSSSNSSVDYLFGDGRDGRRSNSSGSEGRSGQTPGSGAQSLLIGGDTNSVVQRRGSRHLSCDAITTPGSKSPPSGESLSTGSRDVRPSSLPAWAMSGWRRDGNLIMHSKLQHFICQHAVLFVDSNAFRRQHMERMFQSCGFTEILTAVNEAEAVAICKDARSRIAYVVLEHELGRHVANRLRRMLVREVHDPEDIPFVCIDVLVPSNTGLEHSMDEAFDEALVTPVTRNNILQRLERFAGSWSKRLESGALRGGAHSALHSRQ